MTSPTPPKDFSDLDGGPEALEIVRSARDLHRQGRLSAKDERDALELIVQHLSGRSLDRQRGKAITKLVQAMKLAARHPDETTAPKFVLLLHSLLDTRPDPAPLPEELSEEPKPDRR